MSNDEYLMDHKIIQNTLMICFVMLAMASSAQKNWSLGGYVSDIQTAMFDTIKNAWSTENTIHNRLNFYYYPGNNITASIQLRNRFIFGEWIEDIPGYADGIDQDKGWIDMSWNVFEENSFLLNLNADRLWTKFMKGNFEATIGRQRINWGQTFVWNPNDIFNTYNFFDIDYQEKPGSDALRLQYYTGVASVAEAAIKVNSQNEITAAGLYRFNKWEFDVQVLAGILNSSDYIAGLGWTGYVKNAAFRGEISYFHPSEHFEDTTGTLLAATGFDYTFGNSLGIQAEYLYAEFAGPTAANFMDYYSSAISVKNLSFTKHNIFAQATYPFTPLLNGTLSAMAYPGINGYYIGPSLSYSLAENMDASIYIQHFTGEFYDPISMQKIKQHFNLGFLKIKCNF